MQQHMAQAITPQQVPSQSEESTSIPASPVASEVHSWPGDSPPIPEPPTAPDNSSAHPLPDQTAPSQGSRSLNWSERGRKWFDSVRRAVTVIGLSNQNPFWRNVSSRIANTCGILGLLLAITFGATQWIAQDKSIAIARESELVTLALSCSDEEIRNTSICQQFLEKYPDGPKISRREIASADYSHHNNSRAETVRITIEGIAVRLAILDRFFQNQNSLFQSALKIRDPGLSLAHMEDIIRSEIIFLQNIASSETALAHQRADNVDPSLPVVHPTGPLVAIERLLVAWEEHREELSQLYKKMTLENIRALMRVRHKFAPSKKQYVLQFEKWGLYKYDRTKALEKHESMHNDAQLACETTGPTDSASCLTDNTDISVKPPSPIRRKRMPSQRPQVTFKKRQMLDRFTSIKAHGDMDQAFDRSGCISDAEDDHLFSLSLQDDRFPDVLKETTRNNMRGIVEDGVEFKGNRCLDRRPNSDSIFLSFSTAYEASTNSRLEIQVIDTTTETAELSVDDAERIRLAADYLRGAHCYTESFQLYILLFKWSQGHVKTTPSSRIQEISIFGCARTAVIDSHIEIVQNLLELDLKNRPAYSVETAKSFLFKSFLSDFAWHRGDWEAAIKHRNIVCRSGLVENRPFDYLSQEDRSLDLIIYQVLLKVIEDTTLPDVPTSFYYLKNGIISLCPGPFEYSGRCLAKTNLRACLDWFASVLGSSKIFRASWKNLTTLRRRNNLRTSYITLYSDMWESYRRQEKPTLLQEWVVDVETQLGIPPTEMISCVCSMILEAGPLSLRRLDDGFPSSFCKAAQTGVKRLVDLTDLKLAERFLDGFINHKRLFRQACSDEHGKSTSLAPFMTQISEETAFDAGFFSALAPSLSSAGLNSMADLKNRIDDSLETAMGKMSLDVPSAAMGNVSWKSKESLFSGAIDLSSVSFRSIARSDDMTTKAAGATTGIVELIMDQVANKSHF
ncbi:hypothetical protein F4860DRAFT_517926 [Xylaria cubensis]|nr:hypothetical protein F4860DRAFT_517926 [Xylaria cubensis]